jgi:small subunit ribosomal protein S8
MMNDPIADMLTRIRNAQAARHESVSLPYSKIKESIAGILKEAGFIAGVEVTASGAFKTIVITLAELGRITTLTRVSKPGRRMYVSAGEIPLVLGGRGIVIVSTSGGIMTGREARKQGLGGELICKVW